MECGIAMEVLVAVETSHAVALLRYFSILGLVELLLRKGREQQAQPFDLHGRENSHDLCVVVSDRQQLSAADVAEISPVDEENGRRKLRRQVVWQVEVDVEPLQIATLGASDLID